MPLYRYVKKLPETESGNKKSFDKSKLRIISILLIVSGFFLVGSAVYPVIAYQLLVSPRFATSFVSPSTDAAIAQSFGAATLDHNGSTHNSISVERAVSNPGVLGTEIDLVDLTKTSNWLPIADPNSSSEEEPSSYLLSIPKLSIFEARVNIGTEDLKNSLIHYPGTAVPGRYGNTVIFGHSVLPQFFNPKNYTTIFSTLPTLKIGDEIFVDYNQIKYKYVVEHMLEVKPNDISILAQRYDDSYLTLITCVPPGTYLRRLIVRARLTRI